MDNSTHSDDPPRVVRRMRFGLPPTRPIQGNASPRSTPPSSPPRISVSDFEREGREEARKELAALFQRFQDEPELTKSLPEAVARRVSHNNSSFGQPTDRARPLLDNFINIQTLLLLIALFIVGIAVAGLYYKQHLELNARLPFSALSGSSDLISALAECKLHPSMYGIPDSPHNDKNRINKECLAVRDIASLSTSLHLASRAGLVNNVAILLQDGADPLLEDRLGMTPLHEAAHEQVSILLLKSGAKRNAVDHLGRTPLYYARTKQQVLTLLEDSPQQLLLHADNAKSTALLSAVKLLSSPSAEEYRLATARARFLIESTPNDLAEQSILAKDQGGDSVLKLLLEASTLPSARASVGANLLCLVLESLPTNLSASAKEAIAHLDIASTVIRKDALNTLSQLFSQRSALFAPFSQNSLGFYPISFVQSAPVLHSLLSAGASLDVTNKDGTRPSEIILGALTSHHASMRQQYQLVQALKEADPFLQSYLASVPLDLKTAIEVRFASVNAEPKAWSLGTFTLGLELLSSPSHQLYQPVFLGPMNMIKVPLELNPRSSARFEVFITHVATETPHSVDFSMHSDADNVDLEVSIGESTYSRTSGTSWFGAEPFVRLPFIRAHNASDPHFRVVASCSNYLTSCKTSLTAKTTICDNGDNDESLLTPRSSTLVDFGLHLFAFSRLAALIWLPTSMLPAVVPIWLRFVPFFVSMLGFLSAGPLFLLYWICYTSITHLAMRLLGW